MSRNLSIAYFAHSIRSDWNNGNAHFLRGLLRSLGKLGHTVTIFEPEDDWAFRNLRLEPEGEAALAQFTALYPDLNIRTYDLGTAALAAGLRDNLAETDVVILHEWNPPELANLLLDIRSQLAYHLLFHDTHHRASSSPEQIRSFGIARFDGVLAFGEALRAIYRERFSIDRVWTLHEAADTTVFKPRPGIAKSLDVVWIGNWGDDERSAEINAYLLHPAAALRDRTFCIYGVRYPDQGLAALAHAGVRYGGYLPNLNAPATYAASRLTMHIPRQQYTSAMAGIPTIRVFEALACGIPLISAPWVDCENLFREGDFIRVRNDVESQEAIEFLLNNEAEARAQAERGLQTVLARHTCDDRARQLTSILEEFFT